MKSQEAYQIQRKTQDEQDKHSQELTHLHRSKSPKHTETYGKINIKITGQITVTQIFIERDTETQNDTQTTETQNDTLGLSIKF